MAINLVKNVSFVIFSRRASCFTLIKNKVNNNKYSSGGLFKVTVRDVIVKWKEIFFENNISEPKESIEYIVAYTLGTKKITDINYYRNKYLSINEENKIEEFCKQRLKNMPIQYIISEWDFRNLTLKMQPPVFIPRPETEQLVDLVLNDLPRNSSTTLLELCCGSGAISLSILNERPNLKAIAIDKLREACQLTQENAEVLSLQSRINVIETDLNAFDCKNLKKTFDVIVSNPPYILTEDMRTLQPEILLYEDEQALHGGTDGLDLIKVILNISTKLLNLDGKLFLEIDPQQPEMLKTWLQNNPKLELNLKRVYKDFCNKKRFVEIQKVSQGQTANLHSSANQTYLTKSIR